MKNIVFQALAEAARNSEPVTLGVISGLSATSRWPLSVKLKSCPSISSPDFALYSVPKRESVPVGEVFTGQYLYRTVVLLVVWVLFYAGID